MQHATCSTVRGTGPQMARPAQPLASNRRAASLRCSAAAADAEKTKPDWAGDNLLSKVVNAAIATPFLYEPMKVLAKYVLVNSAEENGVDWTGHAKALEATPELETLKEELEDKSIAYPSYYLQQFHAYEAGNLNWRAAYEVEPATQSMGWRVWKDPELMPEAAGERMRSGITDAINAWASAPPKDVLDVGCSAGVSTRWLERVYPEAAITGLDLSPYFLAVAAYREAQKPPGAARIAYVHGLAEATGMRSESYDLITLQFVLHECPAEDSKNILRECLRLVRPGGTVAFVDNDPKSDVIQNLPPALFTLMKSTEPWSDQYYTADFEAMALELGFSEVETFRSDPRHRTVCMRKAAA